MGYYLIYMGNIFECLIYVNYFVEFNLNLKIEENFKYGFGGKLYVIMI